jgi:hypothetical protein
MKPFNIISVMVSVSTLIALIIDFYITTEFNMEGVFLFTAFVLLGFNIIRHLKSKLWEHLIFGMISDLTLLGVSLFGFSILALTLFGYGFTGKEVQSIWVVTTSCNLLLCSITMVDMFHLMKKRQFPAT